MSNTFENAITVTVTGATLTTSVASANATLPLDSAGNVAKYVRVSASASAYVRLGNGTPVAIGTDLMVGPGDPVILATCGYTKIAAIWVAAAGNGVFSGAGVVQVSALENM
ncbi:hypothetical protein BK660_21900 [Pseudomonas brassicacearum]|uniref:Phage protein n=1 Tax=Pseudomonas brassicacearum TaxID=930166 RepID=A0A423HXK3_9PSED|nr:hypothetical protein [Pseudomonas brassicacearum]RON17945.1 hypothetical protein BK660_21900 [Pseudomonas brassicacearum]